MAIAGFQGPKLGKDACAVCGQETSLLKRTQLGDFTEICKDCLKKASPFFIPKESTLDMYHAHLQQMEEGQKLYDAYFAGKKVQKFGKWYGANKILINEDVKLLCATTKKHGTKYYMVYRMADLQEYSEFKKTIKSSDGSESTSTYCYMQFRNVPGVSDLYILIGGKYQKLAKYLKKTMGMSGVKGMKNAISKFKADIASAKEIAKGAKGVADAGFDSPEAEAHAREAMEAANRAFYNGREELVAKADEAIAAVLK